jgi:cytochrome c oxidase assembly factor CtaG/putative copper export protein
MTRATRDLFVALLLAGFVLVACLEIGGGAPTTPPVGIPDPGKFVGWTLPLVKLVTDAAIVLVVGFLAAAAVLLPSSKDEVEGLSVQAVRIASRWAMLWSAASIVLFFLTVSDVLAEPLTQLTSAQIWSFVSVTSLGRAILIQALLGALIAVATRWTLGARALAGLLIFSLVSMLPIALTGHTASSGSHDLATTTLFIHLVGVTLWVGGLAALCWVGIRGSKRLEQAVLRYSSLALWCFAIVGVSGVVNAAVRLGSFSEVFGSSYGHLALGKVAALGALGVFGFRQRQRIISKGSGFVRLAVSELLIMSAAIGLAVALSRSPTPVGPTTLSTAVEELLGGPLPPSPTVLRLLWGFSGSGVGLAVVGLGTAFYLRGVFSMRQRGDDWPVGRTISWLIGMLVIAWATFGGLGVYSHVLFSAHMASHMMLSMVAPIFLILGAPMTLALRTLPGPRQPGEISPRSLLLSFLHSRFSRFITSPFVGPMLFVGSLYGLYFTGIFASLMGNHLGHSVMEVHFLAVGTLYYYVLIGIDPAPRALAPIVRFGMLLVTIPFHAFFAIAVMSSNTVFAGSYFSSLHRPYRTDLLHDQYLGGGMAWAMGEIPLVLVMGALMVQWFRSDSREARRYDRAEGRSGDVDLEAYNAHLRDLAEHGKRRDP